jgi:hypothetical protein
MTDPGHTEHQFFYINQDGSTQPTNKCQVEGCNWFTAVRTPKKRRPKTAHRNTSRSPSGTGLEDLLSFKKED